MSDQFRVKYPRRNPYSVNLLSAYKPRIDPIQVIPISDDSLYLFSYQKNKSFASFELSDYLSVPSFSNISEVVNFDIEYKKEFNDIFNVMYHDYFKTNVDVFTEKMRILLLADIVFDPYVMTRIINQRIGSEEKLVSTHSDDEFKVLLGYLYDVNLHEKVGTDKYDKIFKEIIFTVTKKKYSRFNLMDPNTPIAIGDKTERIEKYKTEFAKSDSFVLDESKYLEKFPRVPISTFHKQEYFKVVSSGLESVINDILDSDTINNYSDIISAANNEYSWMYLDGKENNRFDHMQKRIIGDILISNTFNLDVKLKWDYVNSDSAVLADRYKTVSEDLSLNTRVLDYIHYLQYVSLWNRINKHTLLLKTYSSIATRMATSGILKFETKSFNLVLGLMASILFVPLDYVQTLGKIIRRLDDTVTEIGLRCDITQFVVSNFLRLGVRDPHNYQRLTFNIYDSLQKMFGIIGTWAFELLTLNNMDAAKATFRKMKNPMDITNHILYVPMKNIALPIQFYIELSDPLYTFQNTMQDFPKFKSYIPPQAHKKKSMTIMAKRSDSYISATSNILNAYEHLDWIRLHMDGIGSFITKFIKSSFQVESLNGDIISEILSVHRIVDDKILTMSFKTIIDELSELESLIRAFNKIAPQAVINQQYKMTHRTNTSSLDKMANSVIEYSRSLMQQPPRLEELIESDKDLVMSRMKMIDKSRLEELFGKQVYTKGDFIPFQKMFNVLKHLFISTDNKFKRVILSMDSVFKVLDRVTASQLRLQNFYLLQEKIKTKLNLLAPYLINVVVYLVYDAVSAGVNVGQISTKSGFLPFFPYVYSGSLKK